MANRVISSRRGIPCKSLSMNMTYENNSCYIDSLLVALFHNPVHTNKILSVFLDGGVIEHTHHRTGRKVRKLKGIASDIRNEVRDLANGMNVSYVSHEVKHKETCSNLRSMLQRYNDVYISQVNPSAEPKNFTDEQMDPLDVLQSWMLMFDVPNLVSAKRSILATSSKATNVPKAKLSSIERANRSESFIQTIYFDDLKAKKDRHGIVNMRSFFPISSREIPMNEEYRQLGYIRRFENIEIINTPLLLVYIPRLNGGQKDDTPFAPVKELRLGNGGMLKLSSIIIHTGGDQGGHYTCIIRCNDQFYMYDDMRQKMKKIGNFTSMKEYRHGFILQNAVLFVYV